jgi:hypothetical protein
MAIATDNAHNEAECSNMGICNRENGLCECMEGFTGLACHRLICQSDCSGHGQCLSMRYWATQKDPGLDIAEDYENAIWPYEATWDHDMIYGCVCDNGYTGPDCLLRECPRGDDPLTGTVQDPNGVQYNEEQDITCKATGGTFKLAFRKQTTEPIEWDAMIPDMTKVFNALPTVNHGVGGAIIAYAGIITVACTSLGNIITISFAQDFGDVPLVIPDGLLLLHSSAVESPELRSREKTRGTKENAFCSNRGVCDYSGAVCTCTLGFETSNGAGGIGDALVNRGDCGHANVPTTACPGEMACSSHGTCIGPPAYTCFCSNGWQGGDCSEKVCPSSLAWHDMPTGPSQRPDASYGMIEAHQNGECSNFGTCDRSKGECTCPDNFQGATCNSLICPGSPACNGHGTCFNMQELATRSTNNGDATDFTYGAVPLFPTTWDSTHINGCLCEKGFSGYDCSIIDCPTGDDIWTRGDNFEMQDLTCIGDNGGFVLGFRQDLTLNIDYVATELELKAALELLGTIGEVDVVFTKKLALEVGGVVVDENTTRVATGEELALADVACTSDGSNHILIKFVSELGNPPDLKVVLDGPHSFEIKTDGHGFSVMGTKENAECSNRGMCDITTGKCKCYAGYSSSDGDGNEGERGDCGFLETLYAGSMSEQQNNS